jgi:ferric-dicitrate binding protein FerR (iron transport regulator)
MEKERIIYLLDLYAADNIGTEELRELALYVQQDAEGALITAILAEQIDREPAAAALDLTAWEPLLNEVLTLGKTAEQPAEPTLAHALRKIVPIPLIWRRSAAAAAIFIGLCIGVYFLYFHHPSPGTTDTAKQGAGQRFKNDILPPAGSKTILTLAGGQQIILDSVRNGQLASQGNTKIVKLDSGQLAYTAPPGTSPATAQPGAVPVTYNTLSTSRGGQYQLNLPDGTKVWLNTASSITYPTAFTGSNRQVTITGEAYFEVAQNPSKPFHVKAGTMDVTVLGTSFNINAYTDEPIIKTTLLEGRVKVSHPAASGVSGLPPLTPGQQAQYAKNGSLKIVSDADLDEVMAWKNGRFQFSGAGITAIMRQAERWYDMNVVYKGTSNDRFSGEIPRNANLSQLLNVLAATNKIKFEINGNTVTIIAR